MPLVQGMAFVTGIYSDLNPSLQTVGHAILSFEKFNVSKSVTKYKVGFNDGTTWLVYVFPSGGASYSLSQRGNNLVGNGQFTGYIQIAKIPIGDTTSEATYDNSSGTYSTGMNLFGSTSGLIGTYGYTFNAGGITNSVLPVSVSGDLFTHDTNQKSDPKLLWPREAPEFVFVTKTENGMRKLLKVTENILMSQDSGAIANLKCATPIENPTTNDFA
jgi:Glycosyl hydrolase family 81 N-terminal domain